MKEFQGDFWDQIEGVPEIKKIEDLKKLSKNSLITLYDSVKVRIVNNKRIRLSMHGLQLLTGIKSQSLGQLLLFNGHPIGLKQRYKIYTTLKSFDVGRRINDLCDGD